MPTKYIGYRQGDFNTPYAKFYQETIAPIPTAVLAALQSPALPAGSLPPLSQVADLQQSGYAAVETGFTLEPDGSARVAVLTSMPKVLPKMWDWWFGWHGSHADRYKLWHPKMHQHAEWADGRTDLLSYVGRTSIIEEYISKDLEKGNIRFISPAELGFDSAQAGDKDATVFICARIGYTHWPLDFGWLVHQVRATEDGAEMRSRFWMGGPHIQVRAKGWIPKILSKMLQKSIRMKENQVKDLLIHCAEEMNHLAGFLPKLYTEITIKQPD